MTNFTKLKDISTELRKELILLHSKSKMAHIGSDFSCLDILISLYFDVMREEDHFILSKGHAALGLYSVLHKKGIISDKVYSTLGTNGSILGEHPIVGLKGIEVATGSLGHGLSIGGGMALSNHIDGKSGKIYVVLSDGECQEGSTLEAMNFIGRLKLSNITAIIDSNKWQAYDRTLITPDKLKGEFFSAGWKVLTIDGHNYVKLHKTLLSKSDTPILIIANTILGKGVKQIEDKLEAHYIPPKPDQIDEFIAGIE